MEYHGTKNLNILDSIDQQKERFQFTKPTEKQMFDEFKKFGIGINTIGHPLYEKASKKQLIIYIKHIEQQVASYKQNLTELSKDH
tara:strand:- start:724 stop:978 length:255 start_codon:yes stop_codon:yes gene_type:complete